MKKIYIAFLAAFLLVFSTSFAQEWTIVETFEVPGKASGLAWDGQYIYFGQYSVNGNQIHRLDPATGNYEFVCNGPMEDAYGLTWDGEYLWSTDHPGSYDPGIAYQFDLTGASNYTFECPATYMGGIAYDNGLFWLAAYYNPDGQIYLTDDQGSVLKEFPTPGAQPWDICLQDEFLWIADYNDNQLYKVDTITGALIESHPCENAKPAGIVYDGQYLWYMDGPLSSPSTIYKVDLGGSGTPVINVPVTAWDFGNVAIGDSAVFDMAVWNNGTAPLEVEYIAFPGSAPIFNWSAFPQTIDPGNSIEIPLIYKPQEVGSLDVMVTIYSNDPVTTEVEVSLTGEAVISGPSINLPVTSYTYGYVRVNAVTRWWMQIENIGDENLEISNIISDEATLTIDENTIFPISISPLEVVEVGVWFSPPLNQSYSGILQISNNDPMNPTVEVSVGGTGLDPGGYPIGIQMWQHTINSGWDNSPKAIAPIADISGDGVGDVIVCSEDNFVRCFNGNAYDHADIFWEFEIYSGNIYQQAALFIAIDVDGDGYQDVVVGTTGGDRSVHMISGKTGELIWTFATEYWGDGGWVYAVDASQDHNGDGVPDVLACAGDDSNDTGPNRAFCLDGKDGALLWNTPREGPGFGIICIDDVNGNGYHDVLFGLSNNSETEGRVKCLDGQNGAVIWQKTTPGSSVWGLVQLSDINEDGFNDLAAGDFNGNYFGYDGTNGDQLFSGSIGSYKLILSLQQLDDLNEDGYVDFTVGTSSTNCVAVNGYDGANIWTLPLADKCWNVDRINDISGDGINDVVVGTLFQSNYVYFIDGVLGEEMKSVSYGEAIDAISAVFDIDGDGSMEVVVGGRNGKVVCYSGGLDAWTSFDDSPVTENFFDIQTNPNPFINEVMVSIETSSELNCSINIYSTGGSLIKSFGSQKLSKNPIQITWNGCDQSGAEVNSGLYFLEISDGNHFKTIKLIKQ
jgi:hypothetical protein